MLKHTSQTLLVMVALCLLATPTVPPPASAQEGSRGQTVRIRVENGQEIALYNQSHALVI